MPHFPLINRSNAGLLLGILAVLTARASLFSVYPLMDSTESRYAEIAREMMVANEFVTPITDPDEPFLGKPPLTFWLLSSSFLLFGVADSTARLAIFLVSLVTLCLTYYLGQQSPRRNGLRAVFLLATTGLFFVTSAMVLTDPLLTCSLTAAMALLLRRLSTDGGRGLTAGDAVLLAMALAAGVLSKGLIAIAIPGVAVVLWSILYRSLYFFQFAFWAGVFALVLLLSAPWHLIAEVENPGFLSYYLLGEHFQRFLSAGWNGNLYGKSHEYPYGAIWGFAAVGLLPWWPYLAYHAARAVRGKARLPEKREGFLICWMLAPLLIFSCGRNLQWPYILPSLPPLALLVAARIPSGGWLHLPVGIGKAFVTAAAVVLILPTVGIYRSHEMLVQNFAVLDSDHDAQLVYFEEEPDSAEFYAGHPLVSLGGDVLKLQKELLDSDQDYYVVRQAILPRLKEAGKLERLFSNSRYVLLREKDPADAKPQERFAPGAWSSYLLFLLGRSVG